MKYLFLITCLVFCSAVAEGAVWQQTIESPSHGDIISVDLGVPVETLESIVVHVVGWNIVGGYTCDTMDGGSYYLPEIHFIDGTFGQDGTGDDMQLGVEIWQDEDETANFDVVHELDISDPTVWGFLSDGPAEFTVTYSMPSYSPEGFCMHVIGEFDLYSLTLILTYNETVATEAPSWGTLKALYR